MIEQTITQLRQLKLPGMANALLQQQEQPGTYEDLSFQERLQLLADSEMNDREQRKQQRLLKAAWLKIQAHPQDIDYEHPRGLKKSQLAGLLQCNWINKYQNLLLTGPCGSGSRILSAS